MLIKRIFPLILILCLLLPLPKVQAQSVEGGWVLAELEEDGRRTELYAFALDKALWECTGFTLELEIHLYHGAACDLWQLWLREDGKFRKACTLELEDGYLCEDIFLDEPITFDAVAITPKRSGSFSWDTNLALNDPIYELHPRATDPEEPLEGEWEDARISDGIRTMNVHTFVFAAPLEQVRELTVDVAITMQFNARCRDWQLWGRQNGQFVRLDTMYLEGGDGEMTKIVQLGEPMDLEAIALTPKLSGSFSWNIDMKVHNVLTEQSASAD